jgi:hypothetical protein
MIHFITRIKHINDNFSVLCEFNTHETRLVDLSGWVEGFHKANYFWASLLSDLNYFKTVRWDSYGTLQWDNNVDFCPDVLYEMSIPVSGD